MPRLQAAVAGRDLNRSMGGRRGEGFLRRIFDYHFVDFFGWFIAQEGESSFYVSCFFFEINVRTRSCHAVKATKPCFFIAQRRKKMSEFWSAALFWLLSCVCVCVFTRAFILSESVRAATEREGVRLTTVARSFISFLFHATSIGNDGVETRSRLAALNCAFDFSPAVIRSLLCASSLHNSLAGWYFSCCCN